MHIFVRAHHPPSLHALRVHYKYASAVDGTVVVIVAVVILDTCAMRAEHITMGGAFRFGCTVGRQREVMVGCDFVCCSVLWHVRNSGTSVVS